MAKDVTSGRRKITGAYGELWWNNDKVAEVSGFTAEIEANRSDVQLNISVDSKVTGLKGSGTLTLHKCFTRARAVAEQWNKGIDERLRFVAVIRDPDATGQQEERVSLDNVWFNKIPLI